ncbi:MAG: hypothetical protein SVY53_05165 [Chloroflexota bacterium]|nr:hypothetical protein [Chloroflexota bacterium]
MGSKRVFYGSNEEVDYALWNLLRAIQEYAEYLKNNLIMGLADEEGVDLHSIEMWALELINWNTNARHKFEIRDGNLYSVVGEDNSERD